MMKKLFWLPVLFLLFVACSSNDDDAEFTGNEVTLTLIPGNVQGNPTTGILNIRERKDGKAQIEIELNGVLQNATHPVHLHYGSLADNGNVATMLNPVVETSGIGKSSTILNMLANGETLTYEQLLVFNGSIKIHFEADGQMKDQILGSANIGMNAPDNSVYLEGIKSIAVCNSNY